MKTKIYQTPTAEIIALEVEGTVLNGSVTGGNSVDDFNNGFNF